jgi:UDP-N-acetylglucosamine 2-epimerase (non-hydrolysing)
VEERIHHRTEPRGGSRSRRVLTVIGTRPEAIKLAPVILALKGSDRIVSRVCVTSQHPVLAGQALEQFAIVPDIELALAGDGQTLSGVTARVLEGIEPVIVAERPDFVIVEGDTSTVLAATIAAFHARVPVAHVEAGLRTHDLAHPFPEEANRRIVTTLASLHLAPTEHARRNLVAEGVRPDDVVVTGNPGLDALRIVSAESADAVAAPPGDDRALVLVTVHRRESFGSGLDRICRAVARIARARPNDLRIVLPVHPNPAVEGPVFKMLGHIENVTLVAPMPYRELIDILGRCTLVLTDSGGLQEEGPALGKPVLVMRETTERPEAVEAGASLVIGRDTRRIVEETLALLDDPARYAAMAVPRPIFGDGQAAPRIVEALLR